MTCQFRPMLMIDPEKTAKDLIVFLKNAFSKAGFNKAVIAISGGIDSSTSCALTVQALGKKQVFPVLLPYGDLNRQGINNAINLIKFLQIPKAHVTQIDIQPLVDPLLSKDFNIGPIRTGNIMARIRMIILFDAAKKRQALVVGTENKSEHLLGYYTRFGDEASDIEPLRHLYKTQVYQLAKYLNLPKTILTQQPTAGLWQHQTDQDELGFTYQAGDEILYNLYDLKKSVEELVKKGFKRSTIKKVTGWVDKNTFKHHLPFLPPHQKYRVGDSNP